MTSTSQLCAGDWVQVRSKEEILATLDAQGHLDGLPFMPEMFEFCGQRLRVAKRAHKTCDPPRGLDGRRMERAVHLENVRCNGAAHGGCQARCLMFWKEAWVRKIDPSADDDVKPISFHRAHRADAEDERLERNVWARAHGPQTATGAPTYVCQSTQLGAATTSIRPWDFSQYVEDYTSGNTRLTQIVGAAVAFVCQQIANAGLGLGAPVRFVYDRVQRLRRGTPYPWRVGAIRGGEKTPSTALNLQPGEWVRVKSYEAILATINEDGNNRGMSFDAEMVPYCGGTYRVLDRISRIINEKTGEMHHLKNECIILDQVVCLACYAEFRRFCPRAIYPYWREIWLERFPAPATADAPIAVEERHRPAAAPEPIGAPAAVDGVELAFAVRPRQ